MKERTLQNKAEERKPRTRLTKWLAKIAGKYDGELEPKTEAEFYLNEIAENSGGGSVPEPTISDAGKAIVVNNSGEYALGDVEGSFVVNITQNLDENDDPVITADKTLAEIYVAASNGKNIIATFINNAQNGSTTRMYLSTYGYDSGHDFYSIEFRMDGIKLIGDSENGWEFP